ncbi:hypothetical protein BWI17_14680 [Betaproteobacteria bacterium GR16-43]|nr:hypothetical protein BWI17_14680 [Betaproteobacteria bacterium GR16-43]
MHRDASRRRRPRARLSSRAERPWPRRAWRPCRRPRSPDCWRRRAPAKRPRERLRHATAARPWPRRSGAPRERG